MGKVTAVARGAKRSKSKLLSLTLPFCFNDVLLFRGKSLYTINEGTIVESFQDLLNDFESITYASYLCELIDITMVEEESNRELFKEFVSSLYFMKLKAADNELISRAFELRVLKATGYALNLERCCICKKKINTSDYISLKYLGGVCNKCEKNSGIRIRPSAFSILKFLDNTSLDKLSRLNISKEDKDEIFKVLNEFISQNYERKPKSLEALNYLKRSENNE